MGILNVSSRQLSHWSQTWSFCGEYRNVSLECYNFVNKISLINDPSLTDKRTNLDPELIQLCENILAWNRQSSAPAPSASRLDPVIVTDFNWKCQNNLTERLASGWVEPEWEVFGVRITSLWLIFISENYWTVDCLMICECDLGKNCVSSPLSRSHQIDLSSHDRVGRFVRNGLRRRHV